MKSQKTKRNNRKAHEITENIRTSQETFLFANKYQKTSGNHRKQKGIHNEQLEISEIQMKSNKTTGNHKETQRKL